MPKVLSRKPLQVSPFCSSIALCPAACGTPPEASQPQVTSSLFSFPSLDPLNSHCHQEWWCIPVIPALRRLRQEDCKFEVSLNYIDTISRKKKSYYLAWSFVS
jgi:hypothetical protein